MKAADTIYVSLGNIVRQARRQRELSQEELAQRIGLTRTSITNLEKGRQRIQIHTLVDIAAALGVSPGDLLPSISVPSTDDIERHLQGFQEDERAWITGVITSTER